MPIRCFLTVVLSTVLFAFPSYSQEILGKYTCSDIKGKSLLDTGYSFAVSDDGFSGQSIKILLIKKDGNKMAILEWSGANKRQAGAIIAGENYKDGGVIFFSEINPGENLEVGRSYALFLSKLTLTIVEQHTKIFSQTPQVRVMRADCRSGF